MAKPDRVYWDACTWIAYINEERKTPKSDGTVENRYAMCRSVLEQAQNGQLVIVTSAFTLAEVCKSEKAKNENSGKLQSFLDHEFILVVQLDKNVGIKAQQIQLSGLSVIKPPDAVHLASAQLANVTEFHSFDGKLLSKDGQISADGGHIIKCCKPGEGDLKDTLFDPGNEDG